MNEWLSDILSFLRLILGGALVLGLLIVSFLGRVYLRGILEEHWWIALLIIPVVLGICVWLDHREKGRKNRRR